ERRNARRRACCFRRSGLTGLETSVNRTADHADDELRARGGAKRAAVYRAHVRGRREPVGRSHVPPLTAAGAMPSGLDRAATQRALRGGAPVIACAVLYFAALELGAALRFSDGFAALWPANAVLLATLMLTRPRRWALYLLAVVPAHFAAYAGSGLGAVHLAWQVAHNGALSLAGAAFLHARVAGPHPFDSVRDLAAYLLVVVLMLPAVAALGAPGTILSAFGSASAAASPWTTWRFTWLANAINFLALVPAMVLWGAYGRRWLRSADL